MVDHDRRGLPDPLPPPAFTEPVAGRYLYLGLSADVRAVGPLLLPSAERTRVIGRCHEVLAGCHGLDTSTVLRTTLIPPIRNVPRFDIVVLARTRVPETAGDDPLAVTTAAFDAAGLPVARAMRARNTRRFGDTERPGDATFLLNHFTAAHAEDAQATWEDIAGWYSAVLGVDNSTLLRPAPDASYALINYVRLRGAAVPFLLRQLATPSYYRQVRARLSAHDMAFLPLLLRPAVPDGRPTQR